MNKTAYMRGFVKYAAMGASRFYRYVLPWVVPTSIGVAQTAQIIQNKRIKDGLVQAQDLKDKAQETVNNVNKLTKQVEPVVGSAKQLLALAKDKVNSFDVNTVGKYALGGAGIIGGSILLGNLLSAPKKKRKKDQNQEQED